MGLTDTYGCERIFFTQHGTASGISQYQGNNEICFASYAYAQLYALRYGDAVCRGVLLPGREGIKRGAEC